MLQFQTKRELNGFIRLQKKKGKRIGFIPTMGALHEGHLSMVRRARTENDIVAVSIFVNPIQFNNPEDLRKYPRMPEKDIQALVSERCDILFIPKADEMYPPGETQEAVVDLGHLDRILEGSFRPGHFRGVSIVVKKLLDIVEPDRAYFGKKDYQQLRVIQFMVNVLNIPVEIVPCDTFRESDGLAMSSRNLRLPPAHRAIAPRIHETLQWVRGRMGQFPPKDLCSMAIKRLQDIPEFVPEYFEIADSKTLLPIETWETPNGAVALTAVFLGDVRLIDNLELF